MMMDCRARQQRRDRHHLCGRAAVGKHVAGQLVERKPGPLGPLHLRVCVEDTGSGIAPDVLPHIFEPFFSTKDKAEGVGLGLSVAYGIVQRHGGDIEVDSRVGHGTRFTITLPRRPAGNPSAGGEGHHERREPQVTGGRVDVG